MSESLLNRSEQLQPGITPEIKALALAAATNITTEQPTVAFTYGTHNGTSLVSRNPDLLIGPQQIQEGDNPLYVGIALKATPSHI